MKELLANQLDLENKINILDQKLSNSNEDIEELKNKIIEAQSIEESKEYRLKVIWLRKKLNNYSNIKFLFRIFLLELQKKNLLKLFC